MITVSIGGEERDLADVSERWVNSAINPVKSHGLPVCVRVLVSEPGLDLRLSTPSCGSGGGVRLPNEAEAGVIDLWRRLGLNSPGFDGGNVVAFLKQLQRSYL